MIDHIGIRVTDLAKSIAFYKAALAPLGYTMIMHMEEFGVAGFGMGHKPDFWITGGATTKPEPVHVGLAAPKRSIVNAFYAAAIAGGGVDNGPPDVRPHYHEHYFAAFVRDPDGHNIEVVCHEPYLG